MTDRLKIKFAFGLLTLEQQLAKIKRHCPSMDLLVDDMFVELRAHFMKAFRDGDDVDDDGQDQDPPEVDRFEQVYSLIYELVVAYPVQLVHILWIDCVEQVLTEWAKVTADDYGHPMEYLNYVLNCWHRFQLGTNRIKGYMHNAEIKLVAGNGVLGAMLSPMAKNQLFGELFAHHMLYKTEGAVFETILLTLMITRQAKQSTDDERLLNIATNILKEMFDLLYYLRENDTTTPVYHRLFVLPYLAWLRQHYLGAVAEYLQLPLEQYLEKIWQVLKLEANVEHLGIRPATIILIEKVIFGALVYDQRDKILKFENFQECQSVTLLGDLYRLVKGNTVLLGMFIANATRLVREQLDKQLTKFNLKHYNKVRASMVVNVVEAYLHLYHTWQKMIDQCFEQNQLFIQEFDKCVGRYLDSQPALVGIFSLLIHLVSCRFFFTHVRGNTTHQQDEDETRQRYIGDTFKLLSMVSDKEQVDRLSRYFLCQRILHSLSYNLVVDIDTMAANNLDSSFNARLLMKDWQLLEDKQQPSFTLRLLNSMLWNVSGGERQQTTSTPHKDLQQRYDNFLERYKKEAHYRQRVYRLNSVYSVAEMDAQFPESGQQFTFHLTSEQVSVVQLFNKHDHLTLQQTAKLSQLDADTVQPILWTFYRYHLLNAHKSADQPALKHAKLAEFDQLIFKVNEQFQLNKSRSTSLANESGGGGHKVIDWICLAHIEKIYNVGELLEQVTCWKINENSGGDAQEQEHRQQNKRAATSSSSNVDDEKLPPNWVANSHRSTLVQAAIVRIMKRIVMVPNIEHLYQLVYGAASSSGATATTLSPSVPRVNEKRFEAIVQFLVGRNYLRLQSENIYYED